MITSPTSPSILSRLPLGVRMGFCRLATLKCLKVGDLVFQAGDAALCIFHALSGRILISPTDVDMEEDIVVAGQTLRNQGLTLVPEKQCVEHADAICQQDSVILCIQRADVRVVLNAAEAERFIDLVQVTYRLPHISVHQSVSFS